MALEVIASISCNGTPISLHNCTRLRIVACQPRCTLFGKVSDSQCRSCPSRDPILVMRAGRKPAGPRGLGDVVEACIRWAFMGRIDVAHRLAAFVERLLPSRRRPEPEQPKRGCGCKRRQAALNAAIPFQRNAH